MVPEFEKAGLSFVGRDESGKRMEIIELPTHRFFVGVQFHPEFKSRPGNPSPLFLGLVAASSGQLDQRGVISKTSRCISNTGGASKLKACQNGHLMKPLKGLVNGHYSTTSNGAIPI